MNLKLATVILTCAFLAVGCKVNQQDRPGTPGTAAAPKTEPAPTAGAPPASSSSTTIVNKEASGTSPSGATAPKDQATSSSSATVTPSPATGSSASSSATATDKSGASTGAAGRAGQEDFSKEKPAQMEKQSGGQHSSTEQGGSTGQDKKM
jgi:hypothetical protein